MSQTPFRTPTDLPNAADAALPQIQGERVLVGEIVAPFGVRGQVKMVPLMETPAALIKLPFVTLEFPNPKKPAQTVRVVSVRVQKNLALVEFETVTDRNASEGLRGALVYIAQDELPPLGPDTYYERDLLGLRVVTDAGSDLGAIEKVHFYPANDVYETEFALIPAVEAFVLSVDLDNQQMTVRDVPGLRKNE